MRNNAGCHIMQSARQSLHPDSVLMIVCVSEAECRLLEGCLLCMLVYKWHKIVGQCMQCNHERNI